MPNEVHQVDSPQGFPVICAGDPNGAIRAPKGTLAVDNVTPALWQNSNGVTAWTNIAGGGSGITSWGLETQAHFTGSGNPNGTVTALHAGDVYDDTTGNLWVATAADNSHWITVAAAGGAITSWGLESTSHFTHAGDPNGTVTALAEGDLCLDTTSPALYIANGAGTVWSLVGPGSAATFPISEDDGTNTAEISFGSHTLSLRNTLNAGPTLESDLELFGNGFVQLTGKGIQLQSTDVAQSIFIETTGGAIILDPTTLVISGVNALAADGDLNAGDLSIALDPTNGAGKVLFKAKTANGTVVTGNIPLA